MTATIDNKELMDTLAVGCIYLVSKRALVVFPTSTKAHPSEMVEIHLAFAGATDRSWAKLFPMEVSWHFWQNVVVPVLSENEGAFSTPWKTTTLDLREFFKWKLTEKAQAEGYLPFEEDIPVDLIPLLGEPVNRILPEGAIYQRFDL